MRRCFLARILIAVSMCDLQTRQSFRVARTRESQWARRPSRTASESAKSNTASMTILSTVLIPAAGHSKTTRVEGQLEWHPPELATGHQFKGKAPPTPHLCLAEGGDNRKVSIRPFACCSNSSRSSPHWHNSVLERRLDRD